MAKGKKIETLGELQDAVAKGGKINPRTGCIITPDPDGIQMDRSFMAKAQLKWGCPGCYFSDRNKSIGDTDLCTYPGSPYDGKGHCIKRR